MSKYLEYFDGAFDSTVADKMKPENKPYVAYSRTEGVVYTVISKEPTSAYQMVDLGLPSGLKWADRNVGAENPWDNSLYFSWGNVDGHTVENGNVADDYSFNSDKYSTTSGGQYTGTTLDAEHDAATVNMGSNWRMPTVDETVELVQNTDHYYISKDGSIVAGPFNYGTSVSDKGLDYGAKLHSICFVKKGEVFDYNNRTNFIEIPFAGRCDGSLLVDDGLNGNVWSSSVYNRNAQRARSIFFSSYGDLSGKDEYGNRYIGRSVRGVQV